MFGCTNIPKLQMAFCPERPTDDRVGVCSDAQHPKIQILSNPPTEKAKGVSDSFRSEKRKAERHKRSIRIHIE